MKRIKEKLHLGHHNVAPSAAQTSSAPAPVAATSTSTQPGTGLGLAQPVLSAPPTGTGMAPYSTGTAAPMSSGLTSSGTGLGSGLGTSAPMGSTGWSSSAPGTTSFGAAPLGAGFGQSATTTTTTSSVGSVLEKETTIIEEDRVITPAAESRSVEFVQEAPPAPAHVHREPAVIEHKEKAPVVQEVIRPGVREEIQPVVHREREQLEIREEVQPIYEKSVRPTVVEERELAPEFRPEVRTGVMPIIAEGPRESVSIEAEHRELIMKTPIVEETIHRKVIEEVQPVIHRETIAPKVIREVKPIYEKVIEAPVVTYETLPARYTTATVVTAAPVVVAPPPLVDQQTVTTTTVEREFLPGTASSLTGGRTAAPLGSSTGGYATSSTMGAAPLSSTTGTTSTLGGAPLSSGVTQAPVTQFKEMKIEEREVVYPASSQPPSTFQRY